MCLLSLPFSLQRRTVFWTATTGSGRSLAATEPHSQRVSWLLWRGCSRGHTTLTLSWGRSWRGGSTWARPECRSAKVYINNIWTLWDLYLTPSKPSGHYMYHQFNIQKFYVLPTRVFMCFVWVWEQTAIISLYSINWLVCITETESVYCAVRTGCLSKTDYVSSWKIKI